MSLVRDLLLVVHREAAALAGEVSLLLTRESVTKRDVLSVVYRAERLCSGAVRLRVTAQLPPKSE